MTDAKPPSMAIPFILTGILIVLSFLVMNHSPPEIRDGFRRQDKSAGVPLLDEIDK
ncbi:hypothetical protein [[Pseudopropionibacterium] massiliense]|uniref:hypothetical protein n=1 Tax=[Pseudopropionibacterium] massiliense TaxID=2220000 RepID=UPI0013EF4306|nr:hypothetical protein [[Pseudopropionibacterium] massiliense]